VRLIFRFLFFHSQVNLVLNTVRLLASVAVQNKVDAVMFELIRVVVRDIALHARHSLLPLARDALAPLLDDARNIRV
jgi:hypothetical protein